ncbi:MAG: hypothetical protein ABIH46_06375, partial [Chloroflexota bacterium]
PQPLVSGFLPLFTPAFYRSPYSILVSMDACESSPNQPTASGQKREGSSIRRRASKRVGDKLTGRRLDFRLQVERHYTPDRTAMLAALRVVLGLPKVLPKPRREGR